MSKRQEIAESTGRFLAWNTVLNLGSQGIVALVAVALLPAIISELGVARYGLLSIAMVVFSAVGLLDMGLGRATTKFIAEYLSFGQTHKINLIICTSLLIQGIAGLALGIILAAFTPLITTRLLNIPPDLIVDGREIFYLLALSFPFILISSSLRGAIEATQRFDLVNYVKIFLNLSTYVIPFLASDYHVSISTIVFWMLLSRIVAMIAFFVGFRVAIFPIKIKPVFDKAALKPLLSYSGWVAISNISASILMQIDRFFIASIMTVSALSYYSAPFELLNGLWIIPSALCSVLFPAFSGLKNHDSVRAVELVLRPVKYLLIVLGPVTILSMFFSQDILLVWLNKSFSDNGYHVLQLLVFGVLLNSITWVPTGLIMGLGRPDLITKSQLAQLPIYIVICYSMISMFGIIGAAIAFCFRMLCDLILVFWIAIKLVPGVKSIFRDKSIKYTLYLLLCFAIVLVISNSLLSNMHSKYLVLIFEFLVYLGLCWFYIFDIKDKTVICDLVFKKR
jgi:O-antigen/teichoic acid export membrane protein